MSAQRSADGQESEVGNPIARLKAGLDEDEVAAKAWLPLGNPDAAANGHIARQDPGRVLRQVTACREILDKYEAAEAGCGETQYSGGSHFDIAVIVARDAWKQAVLALATIYPARETP